MLLSLSEKAFINISRGYVPMAILNLKLTMKISYLYRNGLETINVSLW